MILKHKHRNEAHKQQAIGHWVYHNHAAFPLRFLLLNLLGFYAERELEKESDFEVLRHKRPVLRQEERLGEGVGDPDPVRHPVVIEFYVVTGCLLYVPDFKTNIADEDECELD